MDKVYYSCPFQLLRCLYFSSCGKHSDLTLSTLRCSNTNHNPLASNSLFQLPISSHTPLPPPPNSSFQLALLHPPWMPISYSWLLGLCIPVPPSPTNSQNSSPIKIFTKNRFFHLLFFSEYFCPDTQVLPYNPQLASLSLPTSNIHLTWQLPFARYYINQKVSPPSPSLQLCSYQS